MSNSKKQHTIWVQGSNIMYILVSLATAGFLIACIFLIVHGLKFDSKYSLFYLGGGIIFTPFYPYITLWNLPGLIQCKTLLSIIPGEKGVIKSKKGTVPIKDIRNIDLVRNPLNLINDIVIETFNDKKFKIRTYNLIGDFRYQIIVDQYIYPHMTESAKKFGIEK